MSIAVLPKWSRVVLAGGLVVLALALGNPNVAPALGAGTPSPNLTIEIDLSGDTMPECTTNQSPPVDKCKVGVGETFEVSGTLTSLAPLSGWSSVAINIQFAGAVAFVDKPGTAEAVGEDCDILGEGHSLLPAEWEAQCVDLTPPAGSTGTLLLPNVRCTSIGAGTVALVHGGPQDSHVTDDAGDIVNDQNDKGVDEVLTINCAFVWDVNEDGHVSGGDIAAVVMAFGQMPPVNPNADINGDGSITGGDIAAVVLHFGQMAP